MMRVWRSVRKHWGKAIGLVAFASLLGVLWWVLPVQPRATWRLPADCTLFGLSANGAVLVTSDGVSGAPLPGPIRIWDVARGTNRQIELRDIGSFRLARRGVISPYGSYLALTTETTDSTKRRINLIQLATGNVVFSRPAPFWPRQILFSPDSSMAAFPVTDENADDQFLIWDLIAGHERFALNHVDGPLAFSPDGRILAAACDESVGHRVQLWNTETGREFAAIRGVRRGKLEIGFNTERNQVLVVCYEHWRAVYSGKPSPEIPAEEREQRTLSIINFDLHSTSASARETRLSKSLFLLRAAENGQTLLVLRQEEDRRIVLVDPETGRELGELERSAQINVDLRGIRDEWWLNAQTTPEGETLAIAGCLPENRWATRIKEWFPALESSSPGDHEALVLYHTPTGKVMHVIPEVDEYLFSTDGKYLATYCQADQRISIWNIPPRKPLGWFLGIAAVVVAIPAAIWWRARRRAKVLGTEVRS